MQWSDVIRPPSRRHLRQFAGLFLAVFLGLAAWRWFAGRPDGWALLLGALAIAIGVTGLVAPGIIRPVYTGWMMAAFPIGWAVSRLTLGAMFFVVVTPLAWLFRATGRDALRLRRRSLDTYWIPKRQPAGRREYFRQS